MAKTGKAGSVNTKQLSTPLATITAQSYAVKREAYHRLGESMLSEHRRDMGVVVLHADQRQLARSRELGREARGMEIRVQVVGDDGRLDFENAEQMSDSLFEETAAGGIIEIADVL